MSTILIGVDDSPQSADAVAFGGRLARAGGARVILASVFPYDDGPSRSSNPAFREGLKAQATATVRRLRGLLDLPDERVERIVMPNLSAAKALEAIAETSRVTLIVVGRTRHGAMGRVVIGATAERLLHGAPCPVAVVPPGYRDRAPETVHRIGVAYIDSPEGRAALAAGATLVRGLGPHPRLELISAVPDELGPGMFGGLPSGELREVVADHVLAELEKLVNGLRTGLWAEAVRLDGDPAKQLVRHSAELDLLVTGSRGYGPLRAVLAGAVSGRVAREARCPVLVVPRAVQAPLRNLFKTPVAA